MYNEPALAVMDWVLSEAATRGLHVILLLGDNWQDWGGVEQLVVEQRETEHGAERKQDRHGVVLAGIAIQNDAVRGHVSLR